MQRLKLILARSTLAIEAGGCTVLRGAAGLCAHMTHGSILREDAGISAELQGIWPLRSSQMLSDADMRYCKNIGMLFCQGTVLICDLPHVIVC